MKIAVIAKDNNDPFLEEIQLCNREVKIFYHPKKLFYFYKYKHFRELAELILVSDCIYKDFSAKFQQKIWPTSQWRLAIQGIDPNEKSLKELNKITEDVVNFQEPVLFVPNNETHVKMLYPIAKLIKNRKFLIFDDKENAEKHLKLLNEEFIYIEKPNPRIIKSLFKRMIPFKSLIKKTIFFKKYAEQPTSILKRLDWKPSVIVCGNDWSYTKHLIKEAKMLGIPTVCIQEGPQDFDLPYKAMMYADHEFLQGLIHAKYLKRNRFVITGNPRLENFKKPPLPKKPLVMVNGNFTYGIYEDARDSWIKGIAEACKNTNLDFFISKHPRDFGQYKGYKIIKSNAFKIEDQINMSSVLITRFSQVLYEALLRGRPVIYYNPHGEIKKVLTEDKSGAFFYATNPKELENCLCSAIEFEDDMKERIKDFLLLHCGPQDGKAVERCLHALLMVANKQI